MTSIEVGGGLVTITDETIQIDIGPFGALKRLYEQSRLIVVFLIIGLLFEAGSIVFDPFPLAREFGQFIIIFTIGGFTLGVILPKLRNNIGTAAEIRRTAIDWVEYTTGSRLFAPKLRIIVTDGEVTGVRPVPLSFRQLGEQQLEEAIQAFEKAGISIVPADDTTDEDS